MHSISHMKFKWNFAAANTFSHDVSIVARPSAGKPQHRNKK
jgi:hypothetical protein